MCSPATTNPIIGTESVTIVATVLTTRGVFPTSEDAHVTASWITMALWEARKLVGSDPADATMRDDNLLLQQRLTVLTQEFNDGDADDCDACAVMDGPQCPFHQGFVAGAQYLAEAFGAICDDIELADLIHARIATQRTQS